MSTSGGLFAQMHLEWRMQLRRPLVWFCLVVYLLLAIGDTVQAGWSATGGSLINGADAIATRSIIYSLLGVLVAAGVVAEPFARDRTCSAAGLVLVTGANRLSLALGRFVVCAALVLASALMFVPGVVLGTLVPGIAPEFIGPLDASHFGAAAITFIIPNFLFVSACVFAIAARTQSQAAAWGLAVSMLALWVTVRMLLGQDVLRAEFFVAASMLDPFGSIASAEFAMMRTVAENNLLFPPLDGLLLWNRLVWGVVTIVLVGVGVAGFPMRERSANAVPKRQRTSSRRSRPAISGASPLLSMTLWELRTIRRLPGAGLTIGLLAFSLWWSAASAVTHQFSLPSTDLLVHNTGFYFDKILVLTIVWLAGDLCWRERAHRVAPSIDVLPTNDRDRYLSKLVALVAVVLLFWLVSILVGVLYQTAHGYFDFEIDLYLIDSFVMKAPYYVFLAVLALSAQMVIGNRYVAMGAVLLVYLSEVMLDALGLYHPMYRYGRTSFFWYSLMDGYGHFWVAHAWLVVYWSLGATMIGTLGAICMSRDHQRRSSFALLRSRLTRSKAIVLSGVLLVFVLVGSVIWYQSTVLATWPPIDADARKAEIERVLGDEWRDVPQPRVVEISGELDLYPSERRFELRGNFVLVNPHETTIDRVLLLAEPWLRVESISLPGATELQRFDDLNARVLSLDMPLQPGEETSLSFRTSWSSPQGFAVHARNDGIPEVAPTEVIGNGTSLLAIQLMPAIGYTDRVEHKPGWKRRKYGFSYDWSPPSYEIGLMQAHATLHLDWVRRTDMTITTDPDQTVYHPGRLIDSSVDDSGRNRFRYVIDRPSRGWATLVSGRLIETRFTRSGIPDVVMAHDPDHTHALQPFAFALQDAMEHFQERYGPPPFDEFRMVEQSLHFDGMGARSGMGFASEILGWKTDVRASGGEDLHEMAAHIMGMTWFGDQVIPANVAGAKVVHAGLPFWSAQLYLRQRRDPDIDRRLRLQRTTETFRGRSTLIDEEVPFIEEFKDSTMLRAKGAPLVLYLANLMGGPERMERVFSEFLEQWRFQPAPYATAEDLVDRIRNALPLEYRDLVDTVFTHVTTWSLSVQSAEAVPASDGRWKLSATFRASQFRSTGWGESTPVTMDMPVEFVAYRGNGLHEDLVLRRERFVPSGETTTIEWTLDERPTRIAIDPMLLLPDPNPHDNIRSVR